MNLSATFTTQNVTMQNGTYSAVFSLYDANNELIASHDVSVYVSGNTAHISNPDALATWVKAHDSLARGIQTHVNLPATVTNPQPGTGTVTVATFVGNVQANSATSVFRTCSPHGPGGHPCARKAGP